MFNTEREEYEKLWRDMKTFVEYGAIRDRKFFERVLPAVIWEKTDGSFVTLDDYLESAKEKHADTVYYTTDKVSQAQYVSMFEKEGIDVVVLDTVIETQFITLLENEKKIKFVRVDADVAGALKAEGEATDEPALTELMKKVSGNEKLTVKYELLKDTSTPAVLNIPEEARRMEDMMRMYRISTGDMGMQTPSSEATLVINKSNSLVAHIIDVLSSDEARAEQIAGQMYTLALLSQRQLTADELKSFLAQSFEVLEKL